MPQPTCLCFYNARVLLDGEFKNTQLWVIDSKVVTPEEGRSCSIIKRQDCHNRIIAPGFIDIQVNGAFGGDFSACDDLDHCKQLVSMLLTSTGVTAYCPTVITSAPSEYRSRLPRIPFCPGGAKTGATILGVHTEGPCISMSKRGCHPPHLVQTIPSFEDDENDTTVKEFLDGVYGTDRTNVVMLTLAPELPGARACVRQLVSEGIVVSLGHSAADHATGYSALTDGASCLTHLFSAMNAFGHREPALPGLITSRVQLGDRICKLTDAMNQSRKNDDGSGPRGCNTRMNTSPASDASAQEEFRSFSAPPIPPRTLFYGLIADCVHTHAYSLRIAYRLNKDGLCLITDAMAALGLKDGTYKIGETEVEVGGHPRRALQKGTDTLAGVVAPINECVRLFTREVGSGLAYSLTAASLHPAQCLGIERWKGHLHPGADADFVIVDDDVNVYNTWCLGEQVFDAEVGFTWDIPKEFKALTHIAPHESPKVTTYTPTSI